MVVFLIKFLSNLHQNDAIAVMSHAVRCCHTRPGPTPPHATVLVSPWGALRPTRARGPQTIVEICLLGALLHPKTRFWWISAQIRVLKGPTHAIGVPTEARAHASGRVHDMT